MADVQVDDGYTKIANELLEAISRVNLSSYEFRVIMAIMRKTYGFCKKHDYISLSQIEKITGIKSCHVCRTLKKLKANNMIISNGHLTGIQKDYDLWTITHSGNTQTGNTQTGNKVTQTGNKKLPKQVDTKERKKLIQKKDKYLEFVNLTSQEHEKLIEQFGIAKTKDMIKRLNDYIGSKGDKYKSHYHTILVWENKNKDVKVKDNDYFRA